MELARRPWGAARSLGLPTVPVGDLTGDRCVDCEIVHQGPDVQITAWRCLHDGAALRAERCHDHLVISVLRVGACEVVDGRWRRTLDPTAAVIHQPGASYRTRHPQGCHDAGFSIAFRPGLLPPLPSDRPSEVVPVVPSAALAEVLVALHRLRTATVHAPLLAEEQGLRLLEILRREPPLRAGSPAHEVLVDRARAYVAAHYREPVRLADVASAARTSPYHLCRVFRAQTGTTLGRWLLRRRLLAALDGLSEAEDLADLALGCGFSSHAHLTDRCSERWGAPPSELRRRLRARHAERTAAPAEGSR